MKPIEYYGIRNKLKDGDLVLYRGHGIMSNSIHYFDSAYYNHIGIVKCVNDRLFTVEMWTKGIDFIPLSRRINSYDEFCVLRIKNKTPELLSLAIDSILEKVERDEKYDYGLLLRFMIYKKTNIDLIGMSNRNRMICSELAQSFTNNLDVKCYKDIDLITPQDFLRKKDNEEVDVIFY